MEGGKTIDDVYVSEYGNTFTMSGEYTVDQQLKSGILIDTNQDITINIDGDVTLNYSNFNYPVLEIKKANKVIVNITKDITYTNRYEDLLDVGNVQELKVNGNGHTIKSSNEASNFLWLKSDFQGEAYIIGGQYEWGKYSPFVMSGSGTCTFNDVSVTAYSTNISQLSGKVFINGGTYKNITADQHNVSSTVKCNGSNAEMEINDATLSSTDSLANVSAIRVSNNASVVVNGGKVAGFYAVYVDPNGKLVINEGADGTAPEIEGSFCAVWFCEGADVRLNSGTYTTPSRSQEATIRADYPAGKIYLGNISISRSGGTGGIVLNLADSNEAIIDGATIQNGSKGIFYATENMTLKQAVFKNNAEDITIHGNNLLKVENTFTGTAKVSVYSRYDSGYFDDADERQITVATNGTDYQKKLNLVSHYPYYIVAYKKNEDGSEYRYLTKGYKVSTVNAVATVKDDDTLKTLNKNDRIAKDTQVTVIPDEKPGYNFTGWTAEGIELEDKTAVPLTFAMPANNVTLTANYEKAEPVPVDPDEPVNTNHFVTVVNGTAVAEDSTAPAAERVEAAKDTNIIATPAEKPGYRFTGWTAEGIELKDEMAVPLTITMPDNDVTLTAHYEEATEPVPSDPVNTDTVDDGSGIAGAIVAGGVLAWGAYETGTGIYRTVNMRGIPLPTNRAELALLIWEKADKPEPESAELYSDIDEDDTDLQKAARWMVEQELMKDQDDRFWPGVHVSKLRVCITWEQAKQKGLIQ